MEDPAWWPLRMRMVDYGGPERAAEMVGERDELLAAPTLRLSQVGRIDAPETGLSMIDVSGSAGGRLIALWCAERDRPLFVGTDDWRAPSPGARTARPARVVVTEHDATASRVLTHLDALELAFPAVQSLPDDSVLIVGARCALHPDGVADRNAVVVDRDGRVVRSGTIGDGVEYVRTTASGAVWVGYTDQGVLGDYGWGFDPERARVTRPPVGAAGLVRFSPEIETVSEAEGLEHQVLHVYALTVVGESAWAYTYTDFSIAVVDEGGSEEWETDVEAATALVVGTGVVALAGGRFGRYDRIVIGRLLDGRLVRDRTERLVLPDGSDLPPRPRFIGGESVLHVIAGQDWFQAAI